MITDEDEDYGLTRQNDKKDGLHNVENILQYAKMIEIKTMMMIIFFMKEKKSSLRVKNNNPIDNII